MYKADKEGFSCGVRSFRRAAWFSLKIMSDNGKTFIRAKRVTDKQFVDFVKQVSP